MTLITIAPGVRVLRRHPDRDVLIVEGLGEYATLFIESIPGGWCVVNGEAATKRIYEQVRQCEEGGMDEKRFDEMGQQDEPDLLLEVRRLQADNRCLSDNLKHASTALGEHLRPGQTPERAIMRIVGDLAACVKERDAYRRAKAENDERLQIERDEARRTLSALREYLDRSVADEISVDEAIMVLEGLHDEDFRLVDRWASAMAEERNELRLSLLAEQGKVEGATTGWEWTGGMWRRHGYPHAVTARHYGPTNLEQPWQWEVWDTRPALDVRVLGKGYASNARAAMRAADNAIFESRRVRCIAKASQLQGDGVILYPPNGTHQQTPAIMIDRLSDPDLTQAVLATYEKVLFP